jgi:hypothetical protein
MYIMSFRMKAAYFTLAPFRLVDACPCFLLASFELSSDEEVELTIILRFCDIWRMIAWSPLIKRKSGSRL